jgi:DNA-binding transcriptional ArsR family regulator
MNPKLFRQVKEYEKELSLKRRGLVSEIRKKEKELSSLPKNGEALERLRRLNKVHATVNKYWPSHWPAVEVCLSACASLLIKDVGQSLGIVLLGRSAAGKGTVLEMFQDAERTLWQDKFSKSSLLSGYGDASKQDLEARALYREAKHQTVFIGDLNPLLKAGAREGLSSFYADFAVWLDGKGLVYNTGTHGKLGMKGDFSFALVGGATPFREEIWRAMAGLGPRLLFFPVRSPKEKVTYAQYEPAKNECRDAVHALLKELAKIPARSLAWREEPPELEFRKQLAGFCTIMALGQTISNGFGSKERPHPPETPHLEQRLATLAHARALLYGREAVDVSDVDFARAFVRTTAPNKRGVVLLAMSEQKAFEVGQIVEITGLSYGAVNAILDDMRMAGIVELCGPLPREGRGRPAGVWKINPPEEDV